MGRKKLIDPVGEAIFPTEQELEQMDFKITELPSEVEEEQKSEFSPKEIDIKYTDPEWSDYVMSMFLPEEVDNGNPKVQGLRRVAELLLGEFAYSKPVHVNSNGEYAQTQWEIGIYWRRSLPESFSINDELDIPIRVFGAYCGASPHNMKSPYSNYPESMSEVRSESKALRRALNIRGIAAEEVQEKEQGDITLDNSAITEMQKCLIKNVSKRCNVDYIKLCQVQKSKELDALTRAEGSELCRILNAYQQKREVIPVEISLS